MMRPRPVLAALALAVACTLLASACGGDPIQPRATPIPPSNETQRLGVVVVDDGIVLSGRLFGPANEPVVIMSHMRANDQTAWFSFAEELSEHGYAALTYDFRGYGESEGSEDFSKLDDDLRAVISYMRDRGRTKIYLLGASMGGTATLVVAGQEQVGGVIVISPPSEFEGQDALAAVPAIRAPKLFIASEEDTAAKLSMEELLAASVPPVDSETYSGNAHGTDLFDPLRSEHSAEVRQRVIDFLDQISN